MTAALAVCASRGGFACALRRGDEIVPSSPDAPRDLAATVAELCDRAACLPGDLDVIRLDLGPGSYTGLRVAVTFARTLLEFGGARVEVATSMELIALHAWTVLGVPRDRVVRPVLDARRQRLHAAPVRWTEDGVVLVEPPRAEPLEALGEVLDPAEVLVVEDSVREQVAGLARAGTVHAFSADAAALCRLLFDPDLRPREAAPEQLEPLYLMGSYAD